MTASSGAIDCYPMNKGGYAPAPNVIGGWLVTSWFGGRIDPITGVPGKHGGDDLVNTPVTNMEPFYSVLPGRVSQGWDNSGGGNWTSLFGDNGDYWGYGHAAKFVPGVNGMYVPAGTMLGWIDSTGASTGAHMHIAFNQGGSGGYDDPTDPLIAVSLAGKYPNALEGEVVPDPDTPLPPVPPVFTQEDMMAHAMSVEGSPQFYLDSAGEPIWISSRGHRRFLFSAGILEKHPLADPAAGEASEFVHLEPGVSPEIDEQVDYFHVALSAKLNAQIPA